MQEARRHDAAEERKQENSLLIQMLEALLSDDGNDALKRYRALLKRQGDHQPPPP